MIGHYLTHDDFVAFIAGTFLSVIFWFAVWAWNSPCDDDCSGHSKKGRK